MNDLNPMFAIMEHVFKALEPNDLPLPDDDFSEDDEPVSEKDCG